MEPQGEQIGYPRKLIGALLEGGYWQKGPQGPRWVEAEDLHFLRLRAYIERTGDLSSPLAGMVVDLERAIAALSTRHPEAATAVLAVLWLDPEPAVLHRIFGQDRNAKRWVRKATAWIAAYLSGLPVSLPDPESPSCERAYRRAR